jgi:metal-responsive CopG/Arc/MetJ family transcriptional regulator
MGRPSMNLKPTVVRLPSGMDARIDALLKPKEKRADLIRQAIEHELKRRERQRDA